MRCNTLMTHFSFNAESVFLSHLIIQSTCKGSLGARINELKQRVIAENPHRFAVAVPRELRSTSTHLHLLYTPDAAHTHANPSVVVPADTTRPKKPHEKEAVEYHFVTKQQFDADALNNKYVLHQNAASFACKGICFLLTSELILHRFIEHGEYKENQYGTSIEAIRSVQAKNKMCVVDVQPEVGGWGGGGVVMSTAPCLVQCASKCITTQLS